MSLSPALACLEQYPQFVAVRLTPDPKRPGKTNKLPIDPKTGVAASSTDPATWGTYDQASATGMPVGFVLTASDPLWCLDIDGQLHDAPIAASILAALPGAAVEVSQSGNGLHIWGCGTLPAHACKNTPFGIELYHTGRFICLGDQDTATGNAWQDFTALLAPVVSAYFSPAVASAAGVPVSWTDEPRDDWRGSVDDDELIRRARESKPSAKAMFGNGATFEDLWSCNAERLAAAFPSTTDVWGQSEADRALAQHLAFWTGCDCERILSLMLQSGLVRDKWDRTDYLHRTILSAVAQQDAVCQDKRADPPADTASAYDKWQALVAGDMVWPENYSTFNGKVVFPATITNAACAIGIERLSGYVDLMRGGRIFVDGKNDAESDSVISDICARAGVAKCQLTMETVGSCMALCWPQRHAMLELAQSVAWDGRDRISELVSCLTYETQEHADVAHNYFTCWLADGVAAWGSDGYVCDRVLTFAGNQNVGKTEFFKRMAAGVDGAFRSGHLLDPKDKDNVILATQYAIVELGEVDATFRKADIAQLKAFLSQHMDDYRLPYGRRNIKTPRRTLFCATVNDSEFMQDDENRRFMVLSIVNIDRERFNALDKQQIWAQALAQYQAHGRPHLDTDKQRVVNEQHRISGNNAYIEMMADRIDWTRQDRKWMTISEMIEALGFARATKLSAHEQQAIGRYLTKTQQCRKQRQASGMRYLVPVFTLFP